MYSSNFSMFQMAQWLVYRPTSHAIEGCKFEPHMDKEYFFFAWIFYNCFFLSFSFCFENRMRIFFISFHYIYIKYEQMSDHTWIFFPNHIHRQFKLRFRSQEKNCHWMHSTKMWFYSTAQCTFGIVNLLKMMFTNVCMCMCIKYKFHSFAVVSKWKSTGNLLFLLKWRNKKNPHSIFETKWKRNE